jgi:hypothetical protein
LDNRAIGDGCVDATLVLGLLRNSAMLAEEHKNRIACPAKHRKAAKPV